MCIKCLEHAWHLANSMEVWKCWSFCVVVGSGSGVTPESSSQADSLGLCREPGVERAIWSLMGNTGLTKTGGGGFPSPGPS